MRKEPTDRPIVGRTWTVILKSPLFHENTHTHNHTPLKRTRTQTILFSFLPAVIASPEVQLKTATNERRRKTQRSETRDALWEGSGSQLRVRITVSHHSDW